MSALTRLHHWAFQLFLLHSSPRGEPSCPGEEVCSPSAWRVERLVTLEGTVSVTVTESCSCHARSHSCRRQPRPVTLHKGTPLQTTLDLGDCQGHCPHGEHTLFLVSLFLVLLLCVVMLLPSHYKHFLNNIGLVSGHLHMLYEYAVFRRFATYHTVSTYTLSNIVI